MYSNTHIIQLTSYSFIVLYFFIFVISNGVTHFAAAQLTNTDGRTLDFGSLRFANNIFNGSSVFGTLGISMVDGVKITGINILPNNQVSVNLIHMTPTIKTSLPRSVTVSVSAMPISRQYITSIIATASNMTNSGNNRGNPALNAMQGYSSGKGANVNTFDPFSFLSNFQIGSSSLINADWNLPQTVVMGLTGSLLPSSAADFITVTVIPYTGMSTATTTPTISSPAPLRAENNTR